MRSNGFPRTLSNEYNDKTLKRMGYELIDNKWTPKSTKKKEEESTSKGKEPLESKSAKKSLGLDFKGFKMEMRIFMAQMSDSMQKLHVKVNNVAF